MTNPKNQFMRLLHFVRNDIFLMLLLSSSAFAVPPNVKIQPMNYTPPKAERIVLKNGVTVFLMEDHELPLMQIRLLLKSSPYYEPTPDAFELLGPVWRSGGTKTLSPEQVDRRLEDMSTDISAAADEESAIWAMSCLSKNTAASLDVFFDLLFHPDFRADQLELVRAKQLEALRRQDESLAEIARRAFRDVTYGRAHVYAQNPTMATVKAITRAHLQRAQAQVVSPRRAVICVSGDIRKDDFIADLEKRFAMWKPLAPAPLAYDFSLRSPAEGKVFYVEKDFTQSRIIVGGLGPSRHSADQYAIKVADYILGGGGPSRLFSEVRSRRGLAYMVGSALAERQGPGTVAAVCQSMAPATVEATQAILNELKKFSSAPPTADELAMAKDAIVNSFLFGFDSASSVVDSRGGEEFNDYPKDYLDTFSKRILELNAEDIRKVAEKYYKDGSMKIVIVGNEKRFRAPLKELGPVTPIPLNKLD